MRDFPSFFFDPQAAPSAAPDRRHSVAVTVAYPRQRDLAAFYGPAGGPDCTAGRVALPMPFPLAWDP